MSFLQRCSLVPLIFLLNCVWAEDFPFQLKGFFHTEEALLCSIYDEKHGRSHWLKEGDGVPEWEGVTLASVHIKERFVEFESERRGIQRFSLVGARFSVQQVTRTPESMGLETMVRVFKAHERKRNPGKERDD